jgi:hypothetical protein
MNLSYHFFSTSTTLPSYSQHAWIALQELSVDYMFMTDGKVLQMRMKTIKRKSCDQAAREKENVIVGAHAWCQSG